MEIFLLFIFLFYFVLIINSFVNYDIYFINKEGLDNNDINSNNNNSVTTTTLPYIKEHLDIVKTSLNGYPRKHRI